MLRLLSQDLVRSGFVRTPDGVHLYWRAVGHGPLLLCSNGVGVSTFFWKYIVEHFRYRYTVVVWLRSAPIRRRWRKRRSTRPPPT